MCSFHLTEAARKQAELGLTGQNTLAAIKILAEVVVAEDVNDWLTCLSDRGLLTSSEEESLLNVGSESTFERMDTERRFVLANASTYLHPTARAVYLKELFNKAPTESITNLLAELMNCAADTFVRLQEGDGVWQRERATSHQENR
jgi:hypothetical protein